MAKASVKEKQDLKRRENVFLMLLCTHAVPERVCSSLGAELIWVDRF